MNDMKRVNVQLPVELHKELKVFAAHQSQTLETVIANAVKLIVRKESTK